MGNQFSFSVVTDDEDRASLQIDAAIAEVKRIEALLSTFKESSQTNQINAQAGIRPVKVDVEVYDLIARSLKISGLTQGAFDITYGSIDKRLWNFDKDMKALPDPLIAKEMVRLINYRDVVLDREGHTVFLKERGMRIGFGGIGKGYAADRAKEIMVAQGAKSGIVNAAGDLTVWGNQPDGNSWTIGIANPALKETPFGTMTLTNISVATSGDYEKYAVINGKKYSHTIDPKTGYPVHGIRSVTVICGNAELADAMATPVMVMGVKAGLNLINQINGIACILIDDQNAIHTSKNIKLK
jgi:FAD:protein FMN transferase